MKLQILTLSLAATGLLLGCNPAPTTTDPANNTNTIASQPTTSADDAMLVVNMNRVTPDEVGASAGTITVTQRGDALVFTPNLVGLNPGKHGFHIHQNPSCEPETKDGTNVAAAAAGGHYDPAGAQKHTGPDGNGHRGDLPMLEVDSDGKQQDVTMPGLTLEELQNRALVVHQGQDDYSSNPAGNSGPRIACGVIN